MKRATCLLLAAILLFGISNTAFAAKQTGNETAQPLTASDLSDYQDVIDRLNEEYGYSMSFAPEVFSRNNTFESPTNLSVKEFETQLRKDIELDIKVNNEAKAAIESLGSDVDWETAPYLGKSYEIPVNASPLSSQLIGEIQSDAISLKKDLEDNTDSAESTSKTVSSIQATRDPTGNIAFLINVDIDIPTYWKYDKVNSFSDMRIKSGPGYTPESLSYTYRDSRRTLAATFTCTYHNTRGVLVNASSSIFREYVASGDCITNWPNYTIPKTKTNKTYNLIDDFTNTQNCAGYA